MGTKRNRDIGISGNNREKHLTMGITRSDSPKEKRTWQASQKENLHRLQENQQATTQGHRSRWWKRIHLTHTTSKDR